MNDNGQSDGLVVPAKLPNNAAGAAAEVVEEGGRPRGTRPAKRFMLVFIGVRTGRLLLEGRSYRSRTGGSGRWAEQWRRRPARGNVILVRVADDLAAGLQHRSVAVPGVHALARENPGRTVQ